MIAGEKKVPITAELSEQALRTLEELAKKRGVSANTVLEQAIVTEKFLSDKQDAENKVLIERKDRSLEQVILNR